MTADIPRGDGAVKWVSCSWLADRLREQSLLVLDSQPDVHDYILRHIPGAIYFNEKLLRVVEKQLPTGYISPTGMNELLQRSGISSEQAVVVYTDKGGYSKAGDGLEQTMMAYTLARFGHPQVYLLDGGMREWIRQELPLTKEMPIASVSSYESRIRDTLFVDYQQFKAVKDDDNVTVIDVRPPDIYQGYGMWSKPGHIPGALNLPWVQLMNVHNSRLVADDETLSSIVKRLDLNLDRRIIFYCGTGREATAAFCVFKWYLGFPEVALYEGSFTEWTLFPDNPTVTGANPR
ncbi:MAG: sulfurtransferase [Chitinispirillaceae bacterium]